MGKIKKIRLVCLMLNVFISLIAGMGQANTIKDV